MISEKYGDLDIEWIHLIKEALDLGIEKEDIRKFLSRENTQHLILDR